MPFLAVLNQGACKVVEMFEYNIILAVKIMLTLA